MRSVADGADDPRRGCRRLLVWARPPAMRRLFKSMEDRPGMSAARHPRPKIRCALVSMTSLQARREGRQGRLDEALPGRDATSVLQAVDHARDAAAERGDGAADAVLDVAVARGRDLGHGAAVGQILAVGVAVIPPVGEHDGGLALARLHQRSVVGAVSLLPGGHVQGDGQALRIAADVKLAGEATARNPARGDLEMPP